MRVYIDKVVVCVWAGLAQLRSCLSRFGRNFLAGANVPLVLRGLRCTKDGVLQLHLGLPGRESVLRRGSEGARMCRCDQWVPALRPQHIFLSQLLTGRADMTALCPSSPCAVQTSRPVVLTVHTDLHADKVVVYSMLGALRWQYFYFLLKRQGKTAIVGLRVSEEGGCAPAPDWVQALVYVAASLSAQLADSCGAVYV